MLALALVALFQVASSRADPLPLEPSNNSVFNEGGKCTLEWDVDTTGAWKVMNIELMTGANQKMVHLRTIATVDGTDPAANTFEYDCLGVEPNSQIYFYQFTSPASKETLWTTRFTIAAADGSTVEPPEQETLTDGTIVGYGTGALEDPSLVDEPPAFGTDIDGEEDDVTTGGTTSTTRSAADDDDEEPNTSNTRSRSSTSSSTSRTRTSSGEKETETNDPADDSAALAQASFSSAFALLAATLFGSVLFA